MSRDLAIAACSTTCVGFLEKCFHFSADTGREMYDTVSTVSRPCRDPFRGSRRILEFFKDSAEPCRFTWRLLYSLQGMVRTPEGLRPRALWCLFRLYHQLQARAYPGAGPAFMRATDLTGLGHLGLSELNNQMVFRVVVKLIHSELKTPCGFYHLKHCQARFALLSIPGACAQCRRKTLTNASKLFL